MYYIFSLLGDGQWNKSRAVIGCKESLGQSLTEIIDQVWSLKQGFSVRFFYNCWSCWTMNHEPSQATLYNVLLCFSVHRAVVRLICQGVTFLSLKKLTWKTCFSGKICYRSAPLILNKPAVDKSLTPTRHDKDQADTSTSPKLLHAEVGPSYASESDENEKPHQENICVPSKEQLSVSYF